MTMPRFGDLTCDEVVELVPDFVLGTLGDAEAEAVRAHLTACPHAHEEIAELGGVVPYLAAALEPVEPPPELLNRILAAAASERRVALAVGPLAEADGPRSAPAKTATSGPSRPMTAPVGPVTPGPWRRPGRDFALAVAAAFALALLGAWNLSLQGQVSELTAYRQGIAAVLDAAAAPGSQLAVLAADSGTGPRGLAAVRADGTVVLAMRDLAPTVGSQVYEAWLIVGDRPPVPVGGFSVGSSGSAVFVTRTSPVARGAIVALTLEPRPGATTPTLPIVARGIASPPSD